MWLPGEGRFGALNVVSARCHKFFHVRHTEYKPVRRSAIISVHVRGAFTPLPSSLAKYGGRKQKRQAPACILPQSHHRLPHLVQHT